jgi:hypothetical protein
MQYQICLCEESVKHRYNTHNKENTVLQKMQTKHVSKHKKYTSYNPKNATISNTFVYHTKYYGHKK